MPLMMTSATIYNISWISTNPVFSERNSIPLLTKHLKMNDRIRFSCSTNGIEQTAIHRVNEYAAVNCHGPTKFMDSLIGTCMKANDSIIISLREIPMLPNGMSYKPNNDYFFITTSTGDKNGLENGEGGLCRTKNMRLKIRIEAKRTEVNQRSITVPEFPAKSGHVMMIPVNSGQYAVPVIYVPVAKSSELQVAKSSELQVAKSSELQVAKSSESNEDNQKRPVFPYHFIANGQFRATNSNVEDLESHPELRFDANDQPKNFENSAFVTNSNGYIAPKPFKEKDNDFEIEYMDPNSAMKGSYERSGIVVIAIITNYIMISGY